MKLNVEELMPCAVCANDFIECFGITTWWAGCKPCSRRGDRGSHVSAKTQELAIAKWNARQIERQTP